MNPFEALLTSSTQSSVDPEVLEMLGRKAASRFLESGIPLNQAVVQSAKDHPGLNNEHVKRIVEFANNVAFQELFSKSEDKNVHFPVADPGVVIRDLKDGGSPEHDGKTLHGNNNDYKAPPKLEKDTFADPESGLQQLFRNNEHEGRFGQGEDVQKTASVNSDPSMYSDPIEEVHSQYKKLQSARDRLTEASVEFDSIIKTAQDTLFQETKKEIMSPDGLGLAGVLRVFEKIGADKRMVAAVMEPVVERLVADYQTRNLLEPSMTKMAALDCKLVNLDHPLVQAYTGLIKAAEEQVKTSQALKEIESGISTLHEFLRTSSR